MVYLRWAIFVLGYITCKLACFLHIITTHFLSWLARKFNLKLYQVLFIIYSYQFFLQFLFSSFLTIYNSILTFIFRQLFILVSVQAKSLSSIFPYFYFDLFYSLSEYSFIRLLFRDTACFLLIASNLPHLLTSFYPSNYLFYSLHTNVYTISIQIFCISSFYANHKLQWYSS